MLKNNYQLKLKIMGTIGDAVGNAKVWWKSQTIIGTVLMFIPTLIKIFAPEVDVDAVGAVDEVWTAAEGLASYADSVFAQAQEALGFVLAVWGRIKAKVGIKAKLL